MRRITMMDDACTQGKKKGHTRGSQMGGHRRLLMRAGIMLLAVTVSSAMGIGVAQAEDQPLPSMTIGYQTGAITSIYERSLAINGRTYGLMPDVVILDEHRGTTMIPSDLVVTAEVKFHVRKDLGDKIDKMIVRLPR
jgi:hypothetical protein